MISLSISVFGFVQLTIAVKCHCNGMAVKSACIFSTVNCKYKLLSAASRTTKFASFSVLQPISCEFTID